MSSLPNDLKERGYKLIIRTPDRMFATSISWGCTGTKTNIQDVITEARSLIKFIEWAKRQEAQDEHEQSSPHPRQSPTGSLLGR